jgi:hypothetical protein
MNILRLADECPEGYVLTANGSCVKNPCEDKQEFIKNKCYKACKPHQRRDADNRCKNIYKKGQQEPQQCNEDQEYVVNKCYDRCDTGSYRHERTRRCRKDPNYRLQQNRSTNAPQTRREGHRRPTPRPFTTTGNVVVPTRRDPSAPLGMPQTRRVERPPPSSRKTTANTLRRPMLLKNIHKAVPGDRPCNRYEWHNNGRCYQLCPPDQKLHNGRCYSVREYKELTPENRTLRCKPNEMIHKGRCVKLCSDQSVVFNGKCYSSGDFSMARLKKSQCQPNQVFYDGVCYNPDQVWKIARLKNKKKCNPVTEELVGDKCYPKCQQLGYKRDPTTRRCKPTMQPKYLRFLKQAKMPVPGVGCAPGEEFVGFRCHPKCRQGYERDIKNGIPWCIPKKKKHWKPLMPKLTYREPEESAEMPMSEEPLEGNLTPRATPYSHRDN